MGQACWLHVLLALAAAVVQMLPAGPQARSPAVAAPVQLCVGRAAACRAKRPRLPADQVPLRWQKAEAGPAA